MKINQNSPTRARNACERSAGIPARIESRIHSGQECPRSVASRLAVKIIIFCTTLALFAVPLPAQNAKARSAKEFKAAEKPKSEKWAFSLLPIAMQRNPQIDFTIITEMTDEGRKLPAPAFDKPVYYISHSVGQRDKGDGYAGTRTIEYKYLQEKLDGALASNGYRQADSEHPATQLIFIAWGMHTRIEEAERSDGTGDVDSDSGEDSIGSGSDNFYHVLSRAKIVGGKKFADEFADAYHQQATLGVGLAAAGPLRDFIQRDEVTEALVYQIFDECYYLLVTSFEVEALRHNKKKILWTTKISTGARGISFEQSLPGMIENGAYYFGREMTIPDIVTKRATKKATVEIGEAIVQEYIMPSGTTIPPIKDPAPGPSDTNTPRKK